MENIENQTIDQIVKTVRKVLLDEKNLWTAQRCAEYLGYTDKHFRSHIAPRPDFPAAIKLPSKTRETNRYEPSDVKEWAKQWKSKKQKVASI